MSTGENCVSRKENQRSHQQTRENQRGAVSWSCRGERVPGQRGKKREEGSITRAEEKGEGWNEEEKRDGRIKVYYNLNTNNYIFVFNFEGYTGIQMFETTSETCLFFPF